MHSTEKENSMKNIFISEDNNDSVSSVCICDDTGVHYPCPTCKKNYDNEVDALICCMEN